MRALAKRQVSANGTLMQVINYVGGQVEDGLKFLPSAFRSKVEGAARTALERSFYLAKASRQGPLERAVAGDRMHKVIGAFSGALGGVGGVPTAIAEIPVATTIIFRAVQGVAQTYGEDRYSIGQQVCHIVPQRAAQALCRTEQSLHWSDASGGSCCARMCS